MPTIEQIRAARALLGWNQHDLANKAGLSQTGIARIENGTNQPNSKTIEKISKAFDLAGIEFIGRTGVQKRSSDVTVYNGTEGFRQFMDEVYLSAKNHGGEFRLHNAKNLNWYKWLGKDWYEAHAKRMSELTNINFKITAEEGDHNFIGNSFAEYKWWPRDLFDERSFYVFGDKLAFLNFMEDDIEVTVLHNSEFSKGFRILFDIAWDHVTKVPSEAA